MNLYSTLSLIALILSFFLGVTVIIASPKKLMGRAFLSGILFLMLVEFSLFMIFLDKSSSNIMLWGRLATASFCFLPPTWAVISLVYERSNYRELLKRRLWYLSLLYATGLIFFVLLWKVNLFEIPNTFPQDIFLITRLGRFFLIFALLSTVVILINFENTLRLSRIASRKVKRVPLYVLIGAFLFWIYAISQILMYSRISSQLAFAGFMVIIVTNVVLLYYTLKYGLTQLEINLGREVVYSSAIVFIVGVYLLIIGIVGKIVQLAGGSVNTFLSFIAALLFVMALLALLVSKSLKTRVRQFIDRNFYRNKYDYREQWGNFSDSLSSVIGLEDLMLTILKSITNIFGVESAALLLYDETCGSFVVRKTLRAHHLKTMQINRASNFIDWFFRFGEAIEMDRIIQDAEVIGLTDAEKEMFEKSGMQVAVPLITQRKFLGILLLSEKTDQEKFSIEDFELLETLANQSSIAVMNAQLHVDLLISREMESFNKISSFILHDLKNAVSMLSMVVQNAEENWDNQEFQKDMLKTIGNTLERMKNLMTKISTMPRQLELQRKMSQVNSIIEKVISDNRMDELEKIKIKRDLHDLPLTSLDPELIKRVFENLFINSIEAQPNGGKIHITTNVVQKNAPLYMTNKNENPERSYVLVTVSDEGEGMSEEFIRNDLFRPFKSTKRKGLGVGMYQCKEIINAHGGTLEVSSKLSEGTTFRVFLPIVNGYDFKPKTNNWALQDNILLN